MTALLKDLKPAPTEHPLRTVRLERGLTQSELADLAGVSQASISRLESGTDVRGCLLLAVAEALDVPPLDLLNSAQRRATVAAVREVLEVIA